MLKNFFKVLGLCILIGFCVYISWTPLQNVRTDVMTKYFPCEQPIMFSIGTFDPRFGISQQDFIYDIDQAKAVWETPVHRILFIYATSSSFKINLIYDYRQEATQTLKKLGTTIDVSQASYNALRTQYTALRADYTVKKSTLDAHVTTYRQTGQGYPAIVQAQNAINAEVDQINTLVAELNNQASQLNITVDHFNEIGKQTGGADGEFNEALYVQDGNGNHIDIYQYTTNDKLVRVLAHELGHALGFVHVSDPMAIMYAINQSKNIVPTADDLNQLYARCKIQK